MAAARQGNQHFKTYDLVRKMPANKVSSYIFQNNKDLSFSNVTGDWGLYQPAVSNAAAYADLDNDGDLDLIICHNNEPATIFRNNENELRKNHFITLRLTGRAGNTKAFGAKATLTTTDGISQFQELYPVRGYQSSMAPELFFGLPAGGQAIRQIRIVWPDDQVTVLTDPVPDRILSLKESDSIPGPAAAQEPVASPAPGRASLAIATPAPAHRLFSDITAGSGLSFHHHEDDFVDFKDEVLLPYQLHPDKARRWPGPM